MKPNLATSSSPPLDTIIALHSRALTKFHFPVTWIYNFTLCTTQTLKLHSCFYTIHKQLSPTMCRHCNVPSFHYDDAYRKMDESYPTASRTTQLHNLTMTTLRLLDFSSFQWAQVFINLKRLEIELRRYYSQFAHYFLYFNRTSVVRKF